MCGRYALSTPLNELPPVLLEGMGQEHRMRYAPRDMIVPGEPLLFSACTGFMSALLLAGQILLKRS